VVDRRDLSVLHRDELDSAQRVRRAGRLRAIERERGLTVRADARVTQFPGREVREHAPIEAPVLFAPFDPRRRGRHRGAYVVVEERDDLVFRHRFDAIDSKQCRLTADGVDFLDEPLKELGRLGRLRQDPAGTAQPNGPHPLKFSPDPDAVSRRGRRQRRQQRQPPHHVIP